MVSSVIARDGTRAAVVSPAELLRHRPVRDVHPRAGHAPDEQARDDADRQRHDERIEQRPPRIGAEPLDRRQRTRMRRDETMRRGEPGDHRDARAGSRDMPVWRMTVKSTGASSTSPTWKNTGRPIRNPDSSSARSSRRSPSARHQRPRHDHRAARFREQLADHGSQADDQRDEAQRVADALLKRARDVGQRHPGAEPDDHRSDAAAR